jgi:hypothetical protein
MNFIEENVNYPLVFFGGGEAVMPPWKFRIIKLGVSREHQQGGKLGFPKI